MLNTVLHKNIRAIRDFNANDKSMDGADHQLVFGSQQFN